MTKITNYFDSLRHFRLPRTRALQQELDGLRESHEAVSSELQAVREQHQLTRTEDEQRLGELRQQVRQIRSERSQAQQQVEQLERSLAHAEHRQKFAESHMAALEQKLDEERTRHNDSLQVTRTRLVHMQEEQRALLTQQTELTSHLGELGERLLDSGREDRRAERFSLWQLVLLSAVLFITGTLVGVLSMQQRETEATALGEVSNDLRDLHGFMRMHIENQDTLIAELSQSLNRQVEPVILQAPIADDPETEPVTVVDAFVPTPRDVRELQSALAVLGFDTGSGEDDMDLRTRQSLREYAALYGARDAGSVNALDESLLHQLLKDAEQARADATRYGIDSEVIAAIRLGSRRTGVDFAFLMEMARAESNFNASARATYSSGAGLYQFHEKDWLTALHTYGPDYGVEAPGNTAQPARDPATTSILHDPQHDAALALRLNPRLSTLFAAETALYNLQALQQRSGETPGRTELYLAHLIGPADTLALLQALQETPDAIAAQQFPNAATNNPVVFFKRGQQPRSFAELYQWLERKFDTGRYNATAG